MRVIGTAGHVDHGKSTLVEALTGTHPDRLKEEREREMTIDLGFAWLNLPDGEEIGIIDVPGHRDFIENMLAGVAGIDAALFVIAADEGVMPQTREHLAILDLLEVQGGVVALTKVDLIEDPDWIDLVEDDVRRVLNDTVLESAPIIRVSGRKKTGLEELKSALSACLVDHPPRTNTGRPRLPVDRVFTIAGFGTVVTGTLSDGILQVGEEVVILPQGIRGRIRGLQTHKRKEDMAVPGSRTAINISGVNSDQVNRGDVVAHPKDYLPSGRIDARLRLLSDSSTAIHHNIEVKLYVGAAEVVARLRLLGLEELKPGEEGWVQLETVQPVVVVRGDRYIIRRPSPGETLGGGAVLDSHPKGRHKRFAKETLERLEALQKGTPAEIFLQALGSLRIAPVKELVARSELDNESARQVIDDLVASNQLVILEEKRQELAPTSDALVTTLIYWDQLAAKAMEEIRDYHRSFPLRRGMPREELKSRIKLQSRVYSAMIFKLATDRKINEAGPWVMMPGHEIRFSPAQTRVIESLMMRFQASPYSPPTLKECQAELGEDVTQALIDTGRLVPVASDVVFSKEGYEQMVTDLRRLLERQGTVTAAQVRDHFNTSRRYALAFLEYLDERGVTIREGDVRKLRI
jgi:selenocysteine-specific elongation factor